MMQAARMQQHCIDSDIDVHGEAGSPGITVVRARSRSRLVKKAQKVLSDDQCR